MMMVIAKSSHCKIRKFKEEKRPGGQDSTKPYGVRMELNCQIPSRIGECPGTRDSIA